MLTLALSRALWGVPGPEAFEPLCWLTGATTVASGFSYFVGGGKWLVMLRVFAVSCGGLCWPPKNDDD